MLYVFVAHKGKCSLNACKSSLSVCTLCFHAIQLVSGDTRECPPLPALMPKRKAARNDNAVNIQPSLLHTLPRPTEPDQLCVWTANVRERLAVLQGSICKLESEKQVLLSLLSDASDDVIKEVFGDVASEVCPRSSLTASTETLWNAAQGCPTDLLANSISGSSIHPALTSKSLTEPPKQSDAKSQMSQADNTSRVSWASRASFVSEAGQEMDGSVAVSLENDLPFAKDASVQPAPGLQLDGIQSEAATHPTNPMHPADPGSGDIDRPKIHPPSPSMASTILLSSEDEGGKQVESRRIIIR